MHNFTLDQVIEFRKKQDVLAQESAELEVGLQSMKLFYHYLQFSYFNALKEKLLNTNFEYVPERKEIEQKGQLEEEKKQDYSIQKSRIRDQYQSNSKEQAYLESSYEFQKPHQLYNFQSDLQSPAQDDHNFLHNQHSQQSQTQKKDVPHHYREDDGFDNLDIHNQMLSTFSMNQQLLNNSLSPQRLQPKHFNDLNLNGQELPIQIIDENTLESGCDSHRRRYSEQFQVANHSKRTSNVLSSFLNSNSLNYSHVQPQLKSQAEFYRLIKPTPDFDGRDNLQNNRLLQNSQVMNQSKVNRLLVTEHDYQVSDRSAIGEKQSEVKVKNRLMEDELTNLRYKINQLESKLNNHSQQTHEYLNKENHKPTKIDYYTEQFLTSGLQSAQKSQLESTMNPLQQSQPLSHNQNLTNKKPMPNEDIYDKPLQMSSSEHKKLKVVKSEVKEQRHQPAKKSILKNKPSSLRMRAQDLKESARGLSSERQHNQEIKDIKKQQSQSNAQKASEEDGNALKMTQTLRSIDLSQKEIKQSQSKAKRSIVLPRSKSRQKDQTSDSSRKPRAKTPKQNVTDCNHNNQLAKDSHLKKDHSLAIPKPKTASQLRKSGSFDQQNLTLRNHDSTPQIDREQALKDKILKLKRLLKDKDRVIENLNLEKVKLKEKLEEKEALVKKYKNKAKKHKKREHNKK